MHVFLNAVEPAKPTPLWKALIAHVTAEINAAAPATLVLRADVAELVDAHGSGPCGGNPVEVQVLSSA